MECRNDEWQVESRTYTHTYIFVGEREKDWLSENQKESEFRR